MKTKYLEFPLRIKAHNEDGVFEGHGSVFDVVDAYGEAVAKGAFKASLEAHRKAGTSPALLWQHDSHKPIGSYLDMVEDSNGLFVKGQLNLDTQQGRETHSLMRMTPPAVNGLSIGFMPVRQETDDDTGIVTLTEIDLWETSIVTFPANDSARISVVKSLGAGVRPAASLLERALREAIGMDRDQARGFMSKGFSGLDRLREAEDFDRREAIAAAIVLRDTL